MKNWLKVCCVLGALAWGYFPAGVAGASIRGVISEAASGSTRVRIEMNQPETPYVRFVPSDQCWNIDFVGVALERSLAPFAATIGPVRLIQCRQIQQNPVVQRISVFLREPADMKMKREPWGFAFVLKTTANGTAKRSSPGGDSRLRQPLLQPVSEIDEIVLDLKNSRTLPLMAELARRAAVELKFRDVPPERATVSARCRSPLVALETVCRELELVLTREPDGWWVSKPQNPLLAIPAEAIVDSREFEGRPLREVADKILGQSLTKRLAEVMPARRLEEPYVASLRRETPRSWLAGLLQAQGLEAALPQVVAGASTVALAQIQGALAKEQHE
jgi:hypothetical protein